MTTDPVPEDYWLDDGEEHEDGFDAVEEGYDGCLKDRCEDEGD